MRHVTVDPPSQADFAAAIGIGIVGIQARTRLRVGLVFGVFEAGMPILGVALGHDLASLLGHRTRWVGASLLIATGGYGLLQVWRDQPGGDPTAAVQQQVYRCGMTTYRISQLAERVGLRPTTLRFYEQAGLLPAQRSESGYRLYHEDAVERLGFINLGKQLGLPLEEIRDLLQVWEDGLCADVRGRLQPMLVARIAEAEQRAVELDAFTHRLRQALTEIDGPPRLGRCEPGCGFLRHDSPAFVPTELHPHRPDARQEPALIACTLTGSDQTDRIQYWKRLQAQALRREPLDGGLRIDLPATLAGEVAELAAAEQQCCAFFDFTMHLTGGRFRLEVRAPTEAASLQTEVFGTAD